MSGGGSGFAVGTAEADAKMMIAPWWPTEQQAYKLSYAPKEGEVFAVEDMPVYRRSVDRSLGERFVPAVTGRDNGLLDLGALRDLKVERISLFEDRTDGYTMELNLFDGSVYINLDYRHQQYDPALDQPLAPNEMPEDATIIAAADAFLDRFGVDRASYGAPVVDKTWQRYVIMADGDEGSAPSSVGVVYPILIDGREVAEYGGELVGPRVYIRVRDMKVHNVYGLTTRSFERSSYALETDVARLAAFAEKGGLRGPVYRPYSYDAAGNATPIPDEGPLLLGAPTQIMIRMYHGIGSVPNELYLPALRFPIQNLPADPNYYGPKDVVVPLVQEILDQPPIAMPFDKPMTEPAVLR
jgi:hypothetical protein